MSLIKELIKEKLLASEQITDKGKEMGSESKKREQIWSGVVILAARQSSEVPECRSPDWQRSQLTHWG